MFLLKDKQTRTAEIIAVFLVRSDRMRTGHST